MVDTQGSLPLPYRATLTPPHKPQPRQALTQLHLIYFVSTVSQKIKSQTVTFCSFSIICSAFHKHYFIENPYSSPFNFGISTHFKREERETPRSAVIFPKVTQPVLVLNWFMPKCIQEGSHLRTVSCLHL